MASPCHMPLERGGERTWHHVYDVTITFIRDIAGRQLTQIIMCELDTALVGN